MPSDLAPGQDQPPSPSPDPALPEPGILDRWLVPAILCGIALTQFFLAKSSGLSPWKGGGFGMFASVDAPSMRTVTADGIDQDGNPVRIDALDIMSRTDRLRWKSWPDPILIEKLADRIAALDYLPSGSQRDSALQRLRSENPDLDLPSKEDPGEWVRPKRVGDPDGAARPLRAIRVQGWRTRYLGPENKVATEAVGEPVTRGTWP